MAPRRRQRAIRGSYPLILSSILPILTHAQSPPPWNPAPAYHASSVFIEDKAFYIHGGYNNNDSTAAIQTFSIDLSVSFNVSSPPYTKLENAPGSGRILNTLLKDGQQWFFRADSGQASIYNLQNQAVTDAGGYNLIINAKFTSMATVPGKGDIIFPTDVETLTLELKNQYLRRSIRQPVELSRSRLYALAPSNSAQAVFALTGYSDAPNNSSTALIRFDAANTSWETVELKEGAPSPRQGACMVPAHNGTKLVVFGGFPATTINNITNMPGDSLSDIYVLDTANLTWTRGEDGGQMRARSSHACAVSGNSLVIWGGVSGAANAPPGEMLSVYDLKSRKWQEKFTVPDQNLDSGPGSTPSGSNVGTIAGGIGAAALLAVSIFLIYRRRKRRKTGKESQIMHFGRPQTKDLWLRPSPHSILTNLPHDPGVDTKLDYVPLYADFVLRSPEAVYRHPQEDEMQAKERVLDEYRRRREIQLEQQRELDRQIEKEMAEVQVLREKQNGTPNSAGERDRRGPQYWSIGSQADFQRSGSFFGASTDYHGSEPRNPQTCPAGGSNSSIHSN